VKEAARQLPADGGGLVYLDPGVDNFHEEERVFAAVVEGIGDALARHHHRVAAVVVTSIYPALSLDDVLGWRVRTACVPQPSPTRPLPAELRFPGDGGGSRWFPGDWSEGA
jgi:hypothetical protein